jgi:ATP-dependent protease ClpP protease subunit
MSGEIIIKNQSKRVAEIRIEGTIGVPEKAQFDNPEERIATYEAFQHALRKIREIKARTVIVNIRSTGGSVNDALLIHEALSALGCEIVTRCYGYVASAATIIAQAASRGKREISRNALYLIHRASADAEGNAGELTRTADLLDKTDERIADIYAGSSGRAARNFVALMHENGGKGRWLSPEETIENGLADRIIEAGKIRNVIREWLGIESGKVPQPPAEPLHNTPRNAAETLEEEIARCENPTGDDPEQEITDLQNRIVELEAINAKLRAKATQTLPKEDPSTREIRREGNAAAYENDMKNFINS